MIEICIENILQIYTSTWLSHAVLLMTHYLVVIQRKQYAQYFYYLLYPMNNGLIHQRVSRSIDRTLNISFQQRKNIVR